MLELVVVLVIVGVLAAVFVPRFTQPEIDATWYHEQVKAGVRYAQRQAVAQRRSVFVRVQPSLVELCYDAACTIPTLTHITTGAPYALTAPSGVTLSPSTTFSFNGLGQPSAAVTLNIGGHLLNVTGETGYVR
jgi:MSHA pilin protein MshC